MARKQTDLTTFHLTQFLNPKFWTFGDSLNDAFKEAFAKALEENPEAIPYNLCNLLNSVSAWEVEECYAIIHNEDSREAWDSDLMKMVIEPKEPHIHMAVKFKKDKNTGATIEQIAKILGVEPQYIEKPKPGRYSWDNSLAYLVHAKDLEKHQYKPEEVITVIGKPYTAIYHESIERWNKGAIKKQNKRLNEDIDWIEHSILIGELTKSEILLTDEYYKLYALNKRRIDDAFDTYGQRKMYKAIRDLQNGVFQTKVFYIMGKPGTGKSTFAKNFAEKIQKQEFEKSGERWTICQTASTNPVDDYQGEEIVIMDDVRGTTMRADDWLKLLDPWNISPSSARYRNKVVAARCIIITATIPPYEFFYYSKGVGQGTAQEEAVDQFLRRLAAIVEIIDIDQINVKRALTTPETIKHLIPYDNPSLRKDVEAMKEYGIDLNTMKELSSNMEIVEDEKYKDASSDFIQTELAKEVIEGQKSQK